MLDVQRFGCRKMCPRNMVYDSRISRNENISEFGSCFGFYDQRFLSAMYDIFNLANIASQYMIVLKSFERGFNEVDNLNSMLLTWIYINLVSLRGSLRMIIGSRLVRYSGSPEILRSAQIKYILQVSSSLVIAYIRLFS